MNSSRYYLTSPGGTHPAHEVYAKHANAELYLLDKHCPWHSNGKSGIKRYWAWIQNAIQYQFGENVEAIISSGPQFSAVLYQKWRNRKVKNILFLDNETIGFIANKTFSYGTIKAMNWCIQQYDGVIIVGNWLKQLFLQLYPEMQSKVHVITNGLNATMLQNLQGVSAHAFDVPRMLSVGNIYSKWRWNYKGMDEVKAGVKACLEQYPTAYFTHIGEILPELKALFLEEFSSEEVERIRFTGQLASWYSEIPQHNIYIQRSTGESWGIALLEAMAAGLIPITNTTTGAAQVIQQYRTILVDQPISDTINSITVSNIPDIVAYCQSTARKYPESQCAEHFKTAVDAICKA